MPADEAADADWRPRRARGVPAGVIVLHVVLAGALWELTARQTLERPVDRQAPLMLQWFTPPAPAPRQTPPSATQVRRTPQPAGARPRGRSLSPATASTGVPSITTPVSALALPASAASEPATPAAPDIPLLATDATRRAVLGIARQVPIGERAALASAEPPHLRTEQRLGREVARSAVGNCAKGEFAGGGMGLLSLPFFIAAEATGKCRK